MTTHRYSATLAVVLLGAAVASACGDDAPATSATSATTAAPATIAAPTTAAAPATTAAAIDATRSPYCRNVLEWQVRQLTPFDEMDPVQLKAFITEDAAFHHRALELATDEWLVAAWQLSSDTFDDTVVRLLDKYGYSLERVEAEATPEEHALADEPPPEVAESQARVHAFEAEVCKSEQPAPADVTFEGPADADYCAATQALNGAIDGLAESAWRPDAAKALFTSADTLALFDAGTAAAPPEIAADVAAVADWDLKMKIPLLAEYGYDLGALILEGSATELAIINSLDPAIIDAYRRTQAYEQQLCAE